MEYIYLSHVMSQAWLIKKKKKTVVMNWQQWSEQKYCHRL